MCERCKELTRELYAVRDELTAARQSVAVLEMELTIARAQGSELAFYTAEQAANLIQVSVATIYSYIHQGAIPAFRKGTGKGGVRVLQKQRRTVGIQFLRHVETFPSAVDRKSVV